jgi:hypothetical protein
MLRNIITNHKIPCVCICINVTLSPIHTNTLINKDKVRLQTGNKQVTGG